MSTAKKIINFYIITGQIVHILKYLEIGINLTTIKNVYNDFFLRDGYFSFKTLFYI